MNSFINYLLEANIGLVLFMLAYWVLLRKETQFSFKRGYLLGAMLFSVVFPLFHFSGPVTEKIIPSIAELSPSTLLPEIVISANGNTNEQASMAFSIQKTLTWIYWVGSIIFALAFIGRLGAVSRIFIHSEKYRWGHCLVSESREAVPTFSFFYFILIGSADTITEREKEEILWHESLHVQKLHSLDVLFVNLLGILFWFNPVIALYKRVLVQLHEFEADAYVVQHRDVDAYCHLLAKVSLQSSDYHLANHFTNSLTLKRILMMKTPKHNIMLWKKVFALAVIPVFFLLAACNDQLNAQSKDHSLQISQLPISVQQQLEKLKQNNPKSTFLIFKEEGNLDEMGKPYFKRLDLGTMGTLVSSMNEKFFFFEFNERYKLERTLPKNEATVFSNVDDVASPIFGMEQLYKNVARTLRYPESARKMGLEGTVYVQFVIQTNGEATDYQITKGVNEEMDAEALSTLMQLQTKWRPAIHEGSIVKMKMTLPILFKLN